MEGIKKIYQIL